MWQATLPLSPFCHLKIKTEKQLKCWPIHSWQQSDLLVGFFIWVPTCQWCVSHSHHAKEGRSREKLSAEKGKSAPPLRPLTHKHHHLSYKQYVRQDSWLLTFQWDFGPWLRCLFSEKVALVRPPPPTSELQLPVLSPQWLVLRLKFYENWETFAVVKSNQWQSSKITLPWS